ncbi:hypothetical protein [Brevundimonas sp.]|uniref:hypothetical protein n=1 Tax=Brevundimonas sp. TaxID=1871086 RepID=UPI002D32D378|nr:hypothetical protein [Brevundimonas sp.]HYD28908.1 hypothetical protein [Brevundimonas sp.]
MTTNELRIEQTQYGHEINRGTIRVVGPLPTAADAEKALTEIERMTETESLVILAMAEWPVAMADLRELNARNCVLVAETIAALVERGLIESDGGVPYPALAAEEIASEVEARRTRAMVRA